MTAGTTPVGAAVQLVEGVGVAQLLRDIGKASASASESAVELFRLCLGAQRVLQGVIREART